MKRNFAKQFLFFATFFFLTIATQAQYLWNNDSAFKANTANSGRLWGYMFGDYYVKAHSDSANRGGSNQYSGIPTSRSAFAFRRIYLGYDYNITNKFAAEVLLAAEDNFPTGNPTSNTAVAANTPQSGSGDLLGDGKLAFYIKLANIRVRNIWKGSDLVVGQQATPAYPLLSERIWAYRSIERTISDIRRTPSYDMGVGLQGTFDPATKNFGYNLLAANGSSAKPEGDLFKWFYGDVWAMFFDKKLVIDLYTDYERLNWVYNWHHSRQMVKAYVAYNTPALTIGVEGFLNMLKQDAFNTLKTPLPGHAVDTLDATAKGLSMYVHGNIVPGKLRFLARWDLYTPSNKIDNTTYSKYAGNTGNYNDPVTHEQFITAGLDFTPAKNVHFMPNIWYNKYKGQAAAAVDGSKLASDYDIAYRMSFFFTFGK